MTDREQAALETMFECIGRMSPEQFNKFSEELQRIADKDPEEEQEN